VFVSNSRAKSTTDNLFYATRRLYAFGDLLSKHAAHEVRAAPDPAHPCADPVATAWHLCFRVRSTPTSKGVKVQAIKGTDRSAISAPFEEPVYLASPWHEPASPSWSSELADLLQGMSYVLGEPGERSPALPYDVVLAANHQALALGSGGGRDRRLLALASTPSSTPALSASRFWRFVPWRTLPPHPLLFTQAPLRGQACRPTWLH
jgi:hypothetical protein